jgi:hypothetical protein
MTMDDVLEVGLTFRSFTHKRAAFGLRKCVMSDIVTPLKGMGKSDVSDIHDESIRMETEYPLAEVPKVTLPVCPSSVKPLKLEDT